jgi:hypothetical protein
MDEAALKEKKQTQQHLTRHQTKEACRIDGGTREKDRLSQHKKIWAHENRYVTIFLIYKTRFIENY